MILKIIRIIIIVLALHNIGIAGDALDEVNRERARYGLRLFKRDNNLTLAAEHCCKYRAKHFISGHCSGNLSDFHFVPEYKSGPRIGQKVYNLGRLAAGCAAWEQDGPFKNKWGSCCTYDNHTYAGAWWEIGKDGRRYMHLFVRD